MNDSLVEYEECLHNFINLLLKPNIRYKNFRRMQEIEEEFKKTDNKIIIIISTVNKQKPLSLLENIEH